LSGNPDKPTSKSYPPENIGIVTFSVSLRESARSDYANSSSDRSAGYISVSNRESAGAISIESANKKNVIPVSENKLFLT
jgi:hypothetical protein